MNEIHFDLDLVSTQKPFRLDWIDQQCFALLNRQCHPIINGMLIEHEWIIYKGYYIMVILTDWNEREKMW